MSRRYAKLRGVIREKYTLQNSFAVDMGLANSTLSAKLNGRSEWTRAEMERACGLLSIPLAEAYLYFFSV